MLYFLLLALVTFTNALAYYTNSTSTSAIATASPNNLAAGVTVSPISDNATNATSFPSWNPIGFYNTKSYWVGETTKQYPIADAIVTAQPNGADQINSLGNVMKCWSSIETWRNESAIFRNAKIANRTWSVTSFWSTTEATFARSSTIYPANISTYTLCDGTPRVDARPKTTHWSGNSTLSGTFTKTLTPTFREQPCSLSPYDCRVLYHDTDAAVKNENELLNQCGNPAHLDDSPQCLLGGGPVELVYFPVDRNNNSLCNNRTSGALTAKPMMPGLSEITTLGHTFTSDSVYLSFKTLFATYDGFWDYVGPNFTDLIVPLHSTDVSTQCGGWGAAYGAGTALNYADLNWPVPASAYSCQHRCSMSYISSATLNRALGSIGWLLETVSPPEQCNTIWSDVNPVLAVPTKIRDMVPEWSTCSFWNKNIANFWFDPPIALQPAEAMAVPTAPSSPHSTPAAAASTPTSPAAPNTRTASASSPTSAAPTSIQQPSHSSSIEASSDAATASSVSVEAPSQDAEASSVPGAGVEVPYDPSTAYSQELPSSATKSAEALDSVPPALSVLTEAMSTYQSTTAVGPVRTSQHDGGSLPIVQTTASFPQTIGDIVASVIGLTSKPRGNAETTDPVGHPQNSEQAPQPLQTTGDLPEASEPAFSYDPVSSNAGDPAIIETSVPTLVPGDLTFTISDQSTAVQTIIVDSEAITDLGLATIFGHTITRGEGGMAELTGSPTAVPGTHQSVLVANSFTLTASAISSQTNAVVISDSTLSIGGPAVTISGNTITHASDGVLLVGPGTTAAFTALPVPPPSSDQTVWALGSVTITASSDPHYANGFIVDGTSLSQGTGTLVVNGATITAVPGGLQMSGTDMTEVMKATSRAGLNSTASSTSLPSVIITSSSATSLAPTAQPTTSSSSVASSAASTKPDSSLLTTILLCLLCIIGTVT